MQVHKFILGEINNEIDDLSFLIKDKRENKWIPITVCNEI